MLDQLVSTLKSFNERDGVEYLVNETKTRRVESYNIKQQTEMNREIETTQLSLTLYVVFSEKDADGNEKKYRGSYNTFIHPGTSEDELKDIISQGVYAAGFVKNAYYPLVSPTRSYPALPKCIDTNQALDELQSAFFASDNHEKGHISYSEFFIARKDVRIVNSSGVDVSYTTHDVFIETAVHMPTGFGAKTGDNNGGGNIGSDKAEIEVSESYRFSLDDIPTAVAMLKARVAELFLVAEKKAAAKPTPSVGDINILLSGECLSTFFSYYYYCANARLVYQQLSTFKEGTQVQGDGASDKVSDKVSDNVTMVLEPLMQGSSYSRPFDDHGQPLVNHEIIKEGKLLKFWGDTRFASYLEIAPTGNISNVRITGGTASDDELRKHPYLELVSFSDFQVDEITGDFGSEIRLGYFFDGEKTVPVTGGSISGNMAKVHGSLRMSAQEKQYDSYRGPGTVCLRGASISGVETAE